MTNTEKTSVKGSGVEVGGEVPVFLPREIVERLGGTLGVLTGHETIDPITLACRTALAEESFVMQGEIFERHNGRARGFGWAGDLPTDFPTGICRIAFTVAAAQTNTQKVDPQ